MILAFWSRLGTRSKFLCGGLVFGLGGLLLSGCGGCDEPIKGAWVACIKGTPTLMTMDHGSAVPLDIDSSFDPMKWDCSKPNSPESGDESQTINFKPGTPYGPPPPSAASPRASRVATSNPSSAYLPQDLLSLPFLPPLPVPASPSPCESSFPDVIRVAHTRSLVTRISTCPLQIRITIPVVSRPLQIAITPDGATALVTSFDNAVNFIDLASNKVTFTLNTDSTINPNGVAITPDGTKAYITSFNNTNSVVLVLDLQTKTFTKSITVDTYPLGAKLTPDGSQLWVTFPFGQAVYVIDTLSNTIATLLPISQATSVAFNSTGTTAYISSSSVSTGVVIVVDTATYKVVRSYAVATGPTDVKVGFADRFVVVNNKSAGSISVIDLSTGVVNTNAVGDSPSGIAFVR